MKRILLGGLTLAVAATTASANMFDGRWALLGMPCDDAVAVVSIDMVRGDIFYWETRCTLVMDVPIGDGAEARNVELICSGEGDAWARTLLWAVVPSPDGGPDLFIEVDYDNGFVSGRARCA
ncbi:MAG: hypothetical protein KIS96_06830 [Bauldia sp.]|nr:hypothetical protein [Bauldia sp.]